MLLFCLGGLLFLDKLHGLPEIEIAFKGLNFIFSGGS